MQADVKSSEVADVLALCYRNLGVYAKTLLPEHFYSPFTALHREVLDAIDSPYQKVSITAPRGLGKTTTVRAAIMRAITFRDAKFVVYASNSSKSAILQTESIKRELRTNREIRRIFGNIQIDQDDPEWGDESFAKEAWVAFGSILVLPRGWGQQVRGLLYGNDRPDLIVVDDLEKRDELENPENRRKIKEWFHSDLEKCVNRYDKGWRIIYIDTLKHYDSLMQELIDASDWHSVRLDLCDDNYESKVPEFMSSEELRKEAQEHRDKGLLDVFYMEFRCIPVAKEDRGFKQEYFKHYDEADLDGKVLENVVIVDPAKTANMKSADSAVVGIGVDYAGGGIYVRDIVNGKFYPDELYEEMFAMRRRLRAHVVGIEVTGLEEFIKQPIMNEIQRRGPGDAFEPVWLKARGGPVDGEKGKIRRIGALVPYYRQGFVYHNRSCAATLEGQLLGFPRSKLIDVADALAYVVELLELGERYFTGPEEAVEDVEAEFAELEYEPALGEEWLRV